MLKRFFPVSWHYRLSNIKHIFFGYKKYAQFGEDKVLLDLFKGKDNGRYVDIGAHHPYRYSNTFLLHKKGWSGVNIDPNPHTISLFKKARPKDENICCGIGKAGKLTYYQFSDPAVNSFKESEAEKWKKTSFLEFLGTTEVEIRPLSEILQGPIDLLTVDAEGMDLEVLYSYDWKEYPKAIVIEGDESKDFLNEKGYVLYKKCGLSRIYILVGIFIVYEVEHIDEAKRQAEAGITIICLDFLLEEECKKKSIPFTPLRNFVDAESGEEEWWKLSHDISREWYRVPSMNFFKYREVRVAEAPEPIMQAYLAKIFYFVRIFLYLKKAFPRIHFSIPHPVSKNTSSECLMSFQSWAVLDAARMAGLAGSKEYSPTISKKYTFERENIRSRFLKIYNFLMGFAPRRKRKIYMSGYWTHAESLVPLLDDTEIIVLETKKFREIPWRELLKHRMRFFYSHGPVNSSKEKRAREMGNQFIEKWKGAKNEVVAYLQGVRSDLDWGPVMDACEHIIIYSPRIVADIDTLYETMEREKPDLVLQMASVGGPHHYFLLMANIARALHIPSVELEHATVTIDPRSVFSRIETDYLLTYGEVINEWHRRI